MQISPLILIIGGLAVMFFGYFFGLFEGRGQGYKKRKAEEIAEEKQQLLERAATPVPSEPAAPVMPAALPDDPGILRVKDEGGRLRLELDGAPLPADTLSQVQRKRLIEVITRLRPWIEARPSAGTPAAVPQPAVSTPAASPPRPPVPSRPETVAPAVAAAQTEESTPSRSMVGQIDDILQKNIAGTPLASRGVKLMDAPGGGVTVFIGMDRYSSVGEVTDPEVQAALRAAIAAWEKKYTPGV